MKTFGSSSLFLAPEYLGSVNALATGITGFAVALFIMSWNITTFILHTKHIRFLATTSQPFLKYCINNAPLPLVFLFYYLYKAIQYQYDLQLQNVWDIVYLIGGFLLGVIISLFIASFYFFGADKAIYRRMGMIIHRANRRHDIMSVRRKLQPVEKFEVRVDWFLSAKLELRKPRDVRHYSDDFLDTIFKRHHIAAVVAMLVAFIGLVITGFYSEVRIFQLPAAASVSIFFALIIAAAGAFSIFLRSWSLPALLIVYLGFNYLYQQGAIDPRNKMFGLNYENKAERPEYTQANLINIANPKDVESDRQAYLEILNKWKAKQNTEKPPIIFINASGGGLRSAAFVVDALQALDSVSKGSLLKNTFLISGASGGMLGATYFRELYWQKTQGKNINLQDEQYAQNISKDILNPLFSSFVTTDLLAPAQKVKVNGYTYVKDRAYAFEQKFNENTNGILDKTLGQYKEAEGNADIPMNIYSSVVSRDGRKMFMATHPARFLMMTGLDTFKNKDADIDAIDFVSFFNKQNAYNTRIISALRTNATFPYALPNVLLPANPVIDVMDAGLRDNYGTELSLRFIYAFKEWLEQNTSKVIVIQLRGRKLSDWEEPVMNGDNYFGQVASPMWLLQNNFYKLQDYYQNDQFEYLQKSYGNNLVRLTFQYEPTKAESHAALSFHLTEQEKKDIRLSLKNDWNTKETNKFIDLIK